jgi:hypothetical protein
MSLAASDYVPVLHLSLCGGSHRDNHVRAVTQKLRRKLSNSNPANYPRVLMAAYRKRPQLIAPLMVKYCLKVRGFVAAWVKAHPKMPELSKEFLRLVANQLPVDILEMFPIGALGDLTNENQQLALIKKNLIGTSTRSVVFIVVAAATFGAMAWLNS